jgi:hypothetical protein
VAADIGEHIPSLTALGAVGAAFVAMLRLLARPDTRWQPIVEQLEQDNARLRTEIDRLRTQLSEEAP